MKPVFTLGEAIWHHQALLPLCHVNRWLNLELPPAPQIVLTPRRIAALSHMCSHVRLRVVVFFSRWGGVGGGWWVVGGGGGGGQLCSEPWPLAAFMKPDLLVVRWFKAAINPPPPPLLISSSVSTLAFRVSSSSSQSGGMGTFIYLIIFLYLRSPVTHNSSLCLQAFGSTF